MRAQHAAVILAVLVLGGVANAGPSARDVLKSASAHFEKIRDYTAEIDVSVDSPKVHMPRMAATIYYKRPDKLHIESKDGFAMLPKQGVLIGNPVKDFLKSPKPVFRESERVGDCDCYVIQGMYEKDGREVDSTFWIGKKDRLVRRVVVNPEWGPTIKVDVRYEKVAGKYWMPSSTTARVSLPPFPGERVEEEPVKGEPTVVKVDFRDYRVNSGLSDRVFRKNKKK